MKLLIFALSVLSTTTTTLSYLYPTFLDVYNSVPYYNTYGSQYQYLPSPLIVDPFYQDVTRNSISSLAPLNVLPEVPTHVSSQFTVVPLVLVSEENLQILKKVQIIDLSDSNPTMRVNVDENTVECTPAANITLDQPLILHSLRTSIMFPDRVEISDASSVIKIKVGAVMAPVSGKLYVSPDTPVFVRTVFAVPTGPFEIAPVRPVKPNDTLDTVLIESPTPLEPFNVTLLTFPDEIAAPNFQVDEDDEELVNRNSPVVLAPAGIVQSSQPIVSVEPFKNPKESELLSSLKEEANKKKI